jgi:hypothetical protein
MKKPNLLAKKGSPPTRFPGGVENSGVDIYVSEGGLSRPSRFAIDCMSEFVCVKTGTDRPQATESAFYHNSA